MTAPHAPARARVEAWTPARWFLLVIAVTHVPLGIAGLAIDRSFPITAAAAARAEPAYVLGVLRTNGWHSLAALLIGLAALYCTLMPAGARTLALLLGVSHIGIVLFLLVADPDTLLIASNDADQIIHAFTAAGGTTAALLTPRLVVARPATP